MCPIIQSDVIIYISLDANFKFVYCHFQLVIKFVIPKQNFNYHVSSYNLLPKYQLTYIAHYSTETAISVVFKEIARTVNASMLIVLDLSAAFDSVNHGILMDVLARPFACHDFSRYRIIF